MGLDEEIILTGIKGFKGVKHRIQYIKSVNGVDYYNDSKATNPDATIKAIDSMEKPTVLILGGKDKGLDYGELFVKIKTSNVKSIVFTGESAARMYNAAKKEGIPDLSVAEDFTLAVKLAGLSAEYGDAVLLSPACSSFDRFTDYEARGDEFIRITESL